MPFVRVYVRVCMCTHVHAGVGGTCGHAVCHCTHLDYFAKIDSLVTPPWASINPSEADLICCCTREQGIFGVNFSL